MRPTRREPAFARLEERLLLAAQPVVNVDSQTAPIGGTAALAITFDNVPNTAPGSDVGYAPYVDLVLPKNGADGAGVGGDGPTPPVASNQNDGVSFISASYLGTPLAATVIEFDAAGRAVHPFAKDASGNPLVVQASAFGAAAGDQLVVLRLPFGSFVADQPASTINVNVQVSPLADLGTPLTLGAVGGFAFGRDPLDNPTADGPVRGPVDTATITPTLATLTKGFDGPEGETVTGPNYARAYTISFDVATGQTITNAVIRDVLPDGLVVTGPPTLSGAPGTVTYDAATRTVTATLTGAVTGVAGAEASIRIPFYVDQSFASGAPVLDPASGASRTFTNDVTASGTWTPLDPRDATTNFTLDPPGPENTFVAKSIAVQKTQGFAPGGDVPTPGLSAGDTLRYTINGQISDYFSFGALVLTDTLSDGQRFLDGTARLVVTENGITTDLGAFEPANISVTRGADGRTTIVFRVSDELGGDGALSGGRTPVFAATGPATFQIVFDTLVEKTFLATGADVGQGDTIGNTVAVQGNVIGADGQPTGLGNGDTSNSGQTIATGGIAKTIYAVNGTAPVDADAATPGVQVAVASGDTVTFRLRYSLPQTLAASLTLTDYLPLPVFDVDDFTLVFVDTVDGAAPGVNQAKWGPDAAGFDLELVGNPAITESSAANSVTFSFTNFRPIAPVATVADILFTVQVGDRPFGDGLLLTNQVQGTETSTTNTTTSSQAIVQLTITEPSLRITKGIVATDDTAGDFTGPVGPAGVTFSAPGSAGPRFTGTITSAGLAVTPINADLRDIDSGARVTHAVVIENVGRGVNGAFDILLDDLVPQGYRAPAGGLNLSVTDGAGNAIPFVLTSTPDPLGTVRLTIELTDRVGRGALDPFSDTSGTNIAVITYDLEITNTPQPRSQLTNLAEVEDYAAVEGGVNRVPTTPVRLDDTATVVIGDPLFEKRIVTTSVAQTGTGSNALTDLTIGETITFDLVATLREGRIRGFEIVDTLPVSPGQLAFVSASVQSVGANIFRFDTNSATGQGTKVLPGDVIILPPTGNVVRFDFPDDLLNLPDNRADGGDQIVVRVVAVAANVPGNSAGVQLVNTGDLQFLAAGQTARITDTETAEIVGPAFQVTKEANRDEVQGGDIVTYTVRVTPTTSAAPGPLFDLVLEDPLLTGSLTLVPGSVTLVTQPAGGATIVPNPGPNTVSVTAPVLLPGESLVFTYQARVEATVVAGTELPNTATALGDSHPGTLASGAERVFQGTASDSVRVPGPGIEKTVSAADTTLPETGSDRFSASVPDLAIGETVTYRISVTLPEAVTTTVRVIDLLPGSVLGSPLNSAKFEFVSARVTGVGANVSSPTISDLLAVAGVAADLSGDGILDSVTFDFGTLTNRPDGVVDARDRIEIAVTARVLDDPANATGFGRAQINAAEVTFGNGLFASDTAAVEIVEPATRVDKVANRSSGDAGDRVSYELRLLAGGDQSGPAYDVRVTDTVPVGMEIDAATLRFTGPVPVGSTVGYNPLTREISVFVPVYTSDTTPIVVAYDTIVQNSVRPAEVLTNTASVRFDSFPGDPGDRFQRDYDPFTDSASFTVDLPTASKRVVSTTIDDTAFEQGNPLLQDVVVGETVTYLITLRLPEATTNLVVTDRLPRAEGAPPVAGDMRWVSSRILEIGSDLRLQPGAPGVGAQGTVTDPNGDGIRDQIVWDFGQVVNVANNRSDDGDVIIFEVTAIVPNLPTNQPGDTLINTVQAQYSKADGTTALVTQTETIEIVGPELLVDKSTPVTTGDAGDVVTFTVRVTHDASLSSSDAYLLRVTDLLAPGLSLVAGSVTTSGVAATVVRGNGNAGFPNADTTIEVTAERLAEFRATSDEVLTITYQARLTDAVQPGQVLTNTANVTWQSAPALFAEARPDSASDTAQVTVVMPVALTKTIVATSLDETGSSAFDPNRTDLSQGETVTYRLVATLSEGTQTLVVRDTLPAGLQFVSASVTGVGAGLPPALASVANSGTGQQVVFDFGTVVNTGNNVTTDGTVTIEVIARVQDSTAIAAGTVLTNTGQTTVTSPANPTAPGGTQTASAAVAAEVVAPAVSIVKTNAIPAGTLVDANDLIPYTIVVTNASGASGPAYDLVVTDPLLVSLILSVGSVATNRGTVTSGNTAGDTTVSVSIPVLRPGESATITFGATLAQTVTPDATITNVGAVAFDTAAGQGGLPGRLTDDSAVRTALPTIAKAVTATGLLQTGDAQFRAGIADLAIGETVTYTITVTLPEGTVPVRVTDLLPLAGTNGSTGTIQWVSSEITRIGTNLSGSLLGVGAEGTVTAGNGTTVPASVEWNLGTIVNTADNLVTDGDRIVFTVTGRVVDVAANAAGDALRNRAELDYDGAGAAVPLVATADADIVEPSLLAPVKTASIQTGNAGDLVTYAVTVARGTGATAPAFDVVIEDVLPAGLVLQPGSIRLAGLDASRFVVESGNAAGDTVVRVRIAEYLLTDPASLVLRYDARLADTVRDEQVLTNTATLDYDSFPGEAGGTGERNYAQQSGSASVRADFAVGLTKSVLATSLAGTGTAQFDPTLQDVAIGETVTYRLVATLGEGTQRLVVTDVPAAGLEVLGATVVSVGANGSITGSLLGAGAAGSVAANGTVTFDFGTAVTNRGDNVADAGDTIVMEIVARVRDVAGNASGTALANTGTASSDTGTGSVTTPPVVVEVVTPRPVISKDASVLSGDAGDEVTFTVVVSQQGSATGPLYDLRVTDALPAGFALVAGSAAASRGTATTDSATNTVRLDLGGLALLPADDPATTTVNEASVTLTYRARLVDAVEPGQVIVNRAGFTAGSAPDGTTGLRPFSGGDDATVTVAMPVSLLKEIVGTSLGETAGASVNVGEAITYRLTATISEGTQRLVIADSLPAGIEFVSGRVVSLGALTGSALAVGAAPTVAGQSVSFAFGTVVNPGNNAAGDNVVVVEIVGRVADAAGNQAGATLTNAGAVTATSPTDPTRPGGTQSDTDTTTATVTAPVLALDKTTPPAFLVPGETTSFTITLSHAATSTGPAYDVVLADLLADPNLDLVAGSVTTSLGTVVAGNSTGDTTIRIEVPVLRLGETVTITYRALVPATTPVAVTVANTATADFDSNAGVGGRPGTLTDGTTTPVIPGFAKAITATGNPDTAIAAFRPGATDLAIGEAVTYTFTITLPEGTTQSLVLTDLLPAAIATSTAQVQVGFGSGFAGAAAPTIALSGQTLTITFGDVVNGSSAAVDAADVITVTVNGIVADVAGVNAGAALDNAGGLAFTIGGRAGTLGSVAPADLVAPDVVIAKQANRQSGDAGDSFTYTVTLSQRAGATAPAYDVVVTDVLDPRLEIVSVQSSAGKAGFAGQTVTLDLPRLATDETVTLTYAVRMRDSVEPGQTIPNTANLAFDSNPGTGGRAGVGSASAQPLLVVLGLGIEKTIFATSLPETGSEFFQPTVEDLAVGEVVTYQLVATLSEGTQTLLVRDVLPDGLLILPGSVEIVTGGSISAVAGGVRPGTLTPAAQIQGQSIAFDFGTLVNAGDNASNAGDQVVIRFAARVQDLPINIDGRVVENAAEATIASPTAPGAQGGTVTATDSVQAEVVVPLFALDKTVDRVGGDAGDVLTYTIVLRPLPGNDAPAYNLLIEDPLSPLLAAIPGSATASVGTATIVGNTLRFELGVLDDGAPPVVITYRATLTDAIEPGQLVPNTATFSFASSPQAGRAFGGSDGAEVRGVFSVALDKQAVATSLPETGAGAFDPARPDLAVGETVTFRLTATIAEGTQRLVLTDTLPAGLLPEAARLVAVAAGVTANAPVIAIAGQTVTYDFGTVVNTGDNRGGDTVVVEVTARLVPGVTAGALLLNTARAEVSAPTDPSQPGGRLSADAAAAVEAVGPQLALSKRAGATLVGLNEVVAYTIELSQLPGASGPAYDIVVADPITDPALRLLAGSVTTSLPGAVVLQGNGAGDTAIRVAVPLLLPGQTLSIGFSVQAIGVPVPGGIAPNTATFVGVSAPGLPANQTDGFAGLATAQIQIFANQPVAPAGALLPALAEAFARLGATSFTLPPILTGTAQPGATVTLEALDASSRPVSMGSVTADVGGNWLARFPELPVPRFDEQAFAELRTVVERLPDGFRPLAEATPAALSPTAAYTVLSGTTTGAGEIFGLLRDPVSVTFGGAVSPGGIFVAAPGSVGSGPIQAGLMRDLAAPTDLLLNPFALDFLAQQANGAVIGR